MNSIEHTKNSFGKTLRALRWKKHVSQESLAEKSGISRQHISRLECNNDIPSLETLRLIAKGFEIPMAELIGIFESYYYNGSFFSNLNVAENKAKNEYKTKK